MKRDGSAAEAVKPRDAECVVNHSNQALGAWLMKALSYEAERLDAFATAVFIVNRLPTKTLHLQSPWEVLLGTEPDYAAFKTFGCSCYALLTPYNKHKLDFRSKECFLLGYGTHSKCYLCLEPSTNKLLVTRDAVFNEDSFPFHTISIAQQFSEQSQPKNTWLSSLLYFTTCCQPSIIAPAPIPTI